MLKKTLFFTLLFMIFNQLSGTEIVKGILWKSPLNRADFEHMIKIEKGRPLSIKKIRRTVKLLYASGKAEQVAVSKIVKEGNLLLVIHVIPLFHIDDIDIEGNDTVSSHDIKLAGDLWRFSPFFENRLMKVREEIISLYQNKGYNQCAVSIASEKIDKTKVKIKVNIDEGSQEKIEKIRINGDLFPSEERALKIDLSLKYAFSPFTNFNAQKIADEIEQRFMKQMYLDVQVRYNLGETGIVYFTVLKGSKYKILLEGNYYISSKTLREVITSLKNYHNNIDAVTEKLRLLYNTLAFPDAKVGIHKNKAEDSFGNPTIEYNITIDENDRQFLQRLDFTGISKQHAEILRDSVYDYMKELIDDESWPDIYLQRSVTGGGYIDTDSKRVKAIKRSKEDKAFIPDIEYVFPETYIEPVKRFIHEQFISQGYLDVEIIGVNHIKTMTGYNVQYDIIPGDTYILSWIEIDTGKQELNEKILDSMYISKDIPYNEEMRIELQKRLETLLHEDGYLFADIRERIDKQNKKISLSYTVDNIFKVRVGEIVFNGAVNSDISSLQRLIRLESNQELNSTVLTQSRQYLLHTAVFDSVSVSMIDADFPADYKDIVVTLKESARFRFHPGLGISSDEGVRALGTYEVKNYFGRAFTFRATGKINRKFDFFMHERFKEFFNEELSFLETFDALINVSATIPDIYFFPVPLSLQAEMFLNYYTQSKGMLPYRLLKQGFLFSFYRKFTNYFYFSFAHDFSWQTIDDYLENEESGDVKIEHAERIVYVPEISGYIDFRDDIFFPRKGIKYSFKLKELITLDGTNTQYSYVENALSIYLPLQYKRVYSGEWVPKDTLIFHIHLQSGVLFLHSGELTSDDILKLGGSTTIRGYAMNTLYPSDNLDENHEGKYYALIRNEMRVKVRNRIYLIGFFDAGNLWESYKNVGKNDLLRFTTGGGLTFVSPIGSINVQLGFNLFPRELENYKEDLWAFHFFISSF